MPVPVKKKYNIAQKVSVLSEGDREFGQKLLQLYICSFQELKKSFVTVAATGDIKAYAFLHHKYRTTFMMFDLEELALEMEKSREILVAKGPQAAEMAEAIARVERYCTEILEEMADGC